MALDLGVVSLRPMLSVEITQTNEQTNNKMVLCARSCFTCLTCTTLLNYYCNDSSQLHCDLGPNISSFLQN